MMKKVYSYVLSLAMIISLLMINTSAVMAASYTVKAGQTKEISLAQGAYTLTYTYSGSTTGEVYITTDQAAAAATMGSDRLPDYISGSYASFDKASTLMRAIIMDEEKTAYIALKSSDKDATVSLTTVKNKAGGTLSKGIYFDGTGLGDKNHVSYYKVKTTANGYINVTVSINKAFKESGGYSIKVLKSDKKTSVTSSFDTFGYGEKALGIALKKGTYYLAIKAAAPVYRIKYTFYKKGQGGGAKRKKAKKLKKNTATKGLIYATGNKTTWYKYYNSKKQKLTTIIGIDGVTGSTKGGLKLTVYYWDSKTSFYPSAFKCYVNDGTKNSLRYKDFKIQSNSKVSKGWYYVKVVKTGSCAAKYTITFK